MNRKVLNYSEFILEEEISFDIDSVVKNIKEYIIKIYKNKDQVLKYFDKVIEYVYQLPKKTKISILVLIIPIFSSYLSNSEIYNKIDINDHQSIKSEIRGGLNSIKTKLTLSQDGWNFIKGYEKLSLKAYSLGDGKITIGWGHAEDIDKSKYKEGDEITKEDAMKLIKNDMKVSANGIRKILREWKNKGIKVNLNQNQFDVLVSLSFNCGNQSIRESDFIQEIKRGNFKRAGDLIKSFNISGNYPGLEKRRKLESELFLKNK